MGLIMFRATVKPGAMDDLQAALEAAEMDRQVLAAQRDGWMASFQVTGDGATD